jgi:hypothetical protein
VIVLSERLSAPAALGAVLILGGLLVLAAPDVRRPATVPDPGNPQARAHTRGPGTHEPEVVV